MFHNFQRLATKWWRRRALVKQWGLFAGWKAEFRWRKDNKDNKNNKNIKENKDDKITKIMMTRMMMKAVFRQD